MKTFTVTTSRVKRPCHAGPRRGPRTPSFLLPGLSGVERLGCKKGRSQEVPSEQPLTGETLLAPLFGKRPRAPLSVTRVAPLVGVRSLMELSSFFQARTHWSCLSATC